MRRETKIGVFIGISLFIIATFVFVVGDLSTFFRKKGYPLFVDYASASGLEERAVVRMAGVKVGFVRSIRLKGSRAEVELSINPGINVPKGSKATLASLGLLGEKHIEIIPGKADEFCLAGGQLEGIPPVSFDQMGTLLLAIGDEFKEIGRTVGETVGGEESRANFQDMLRNLATFSEDLNQFFGEHKGDIRRGLTSSNQAIQVFEEQVEKVSRNIDELVSILKETVEENRTEIKVNLKNIQELIRAIEESLKIVNQTLEKINKGEGTLGKLIQDPDLYRRVEGAMEELEKVIAPVSSLRFSGGIRVDYYGKSEELKSYFNFSIWPTPKKYFLAQIIHDPWLDKLLYSAQGGLRWGDIAPRIGILESEIGVGLDYYVARDRLRFSLEGYDFNRSPRPHFRFSTRYGPSRFIHILFGVDDLALASSRELFFGLELGF